MTFQEEPRNSTQSVMPEFDITAHEVKELLADPSGHGLSNYLASHAKEFVYSGQNLKTPFRVLWYAENLGLTQQTYTGQHRDAKVIRLRDILDQLNRANGMNGKAPVALSTVLNGLSPLSKSLLAGFNVKLLINRQEETIKLLSEAFAANMMSNMRSDAERVFKRYNDVLEQAQAVGVDTSRLIVGNTEMTRMQKNLAPAA